MAKVICFLLAVLCGLASINVSFAEPSTTYGAAPAKYPAASPPKYEPPSPPSPPAPPAKYETPTTSEKPKYEEMKKEEYKTEEKPAEYKKDEKMPEYGGGKKYRRSIIDDEEEEIQSDPYRRPTTPNYIKTVRDAVIMKLLSDPLFSESLENDFKPPSASYVASLVRPKMRADPFSMMNDPRRKGIGGAIPIDKGDAIPISYEYDMLSIFGDDPFSTVNDPGWLGSVARLAGNVVSGLLNDERACRNMGLSRKQAKLVRDAVMVAAENDPGFGKDFAKEFAKKTAKAAGSYIGSQLRGDPFSVTVQDLVEMYGRDPAKGKGGKAGKYAGKFVSGILGGLSGDEEIFMDDMMDFKI